MGTAKCSVCGRMYSQSGLLGDHDKGIQFMAGLVKKPICPDCKRAGLTSGGGNGAAAQESAANARLAEAQAKAIEKQAAAAAKAQEMAADAAFASTMSKFTFSGEPEEIAQDFESVYQYWLKKDLKKDQKKVVADENKTNTNCYIDDASSNIRFIFVDSEPHRAGYTLDDMRSFVSSVLSGIPNGYKTIIFS